MSQSAEVDYDFPFLCQTFARWYSRHGYTHRRLGVRGPSGPVVTKLLEGTWKSSRPQQVCEAIDVGFGWPEGTAWRVLTTRFDPLEEGAVGGPDDHGSQFVESSTGERVSSGVTNEDLLREILRNRAESDQLRAEVRDSVSEYRQGFADVREDITILSARVARLEQSRSESMGGS